MMPASGHPQYATGTIPSLDGIRAIAVALVFFAHSGFDDLIPGGLGVTIFFVLSGYLITTLMRIEHARGGGISYRGFYLRRLLRLMPPLFIVVAVAGLLAALSIIDGGFTPGGLFSALFYFGNYHVIANDYHGMPAGLGVIWSLAIEEHYYLFYPPLAALLLRVGRVGLSVTVLSILCVAVLAWRYWLVFHGGSEAYITVATDTRVDAILIGCLMALLLNPWLDPIPPPKALNDWGIAAICVAVLMGTLLYRDEVFRLTARYTLQCLAIAPLIYLAVARAERLPFRWLNARPLVYIGTISYTIYLSHHVILLGLAKHWPQLGWIGLTLAGAAVTLAVAEPMRRWVEQPCARLRKRLHRKTLVRQPAPGILPVGAP
ncbi:MAG: acyltransferase [Sulfuricaulis sp.]|uniref:acyltransferase family protein n=1 Tax=Sulfuricaulis sp. TaxID=2003553 RepID=UPI0025DAA486|nr:acyltransferase [Sulfuricaulis sp.]MCR4348073.1 acyltransferase [Sulfuricaulis sp.]